MRTMVFLSPGQSVAAALEGLDLWPGDMVTIFPYKGRVAHLYTVGRDGSPKEVA